MPACWKCEGIVVALLRPTRVRLADDGKSKSGASYNALHGTGADAEFAGYLQDAVAFGAKQLDAFFDLGIYARPAKRDSFRLSPRKPGVHPFANDASLKFGEYTQHLEHGLSGSGRRIEALLVQEQVDALVP
jgi:hypothetical protein